MINSKFNKADTSFTAKCGATQQPNKLLYIYAMPSSDYPMMELSIPNFSAPGIYSITDSIGSNGEPYTPISTASASFIYGQYSNSGNTYAQSGTITITAVTPYLTGTFNFIGADGNEFTNGTFVTLIHQEP